MGVALDVDSGGTALTFPQYEGEIIDSPPDPYDTHERAKRFIGKLITLVGTMIPRLFTARPAAAAVQMALKGPLASKALGIANPAK